MFPLASVFPLLSQMIILEKKSMYQKFVLIRDEFTFSCFRPIFESAVYEGTTIFPITDTPPDIYPCLKNYHCFIKYVIIMFLLANYKSILHHGNIKRWKLQNLLTISSVRILNSFELNNDQKKVLSEFKAQKLGKSKNLVTQEADKGNTDVILDKRSYTNAIEDIVNDNAKFFKLDITAGKDITHIINLKKTITSELKLLKNKEIIDKSSQKSIKPVVSKSGVINTGY